MDSFTQTGVSIIFNELFSLCFLHTCDSPVLSDLPLQVLSLESLSLSSLRAWHFLSLHVCLHRAFLILVHINCTKFVPSGPFLIGWGLLVPPRFLIRVPSLLKQWQSCIMWRLNGPHDSCKIHSACWSSPPSWVYLESWSRLTTSCTSLQPLLTCSGLETSSSDLCCSWCSLEWVTMP